ncbi:hypothetical protein SCLCIDRAFT_1207043 [Scleroderma citrinum Foug A]|uniref:Uncharacterized protein n=1 Tax=Scleroderma citrinum Foug A TaxID=1036808 RepID=A0A0C3AAQ2_9AGAM|nr:hypothetical protein SCLCIDRAFT_1207043 [Scleroderma citrinum Foug A]
MNRILQGGPVTITRNTAFWYPTIEYEINDEDKDDDNELESDEGSDYESATDFIGDGGEDTAEPNVNS